MISSEKRFFYKKALLFCLVLIGLSLLLFDSVLKDFYNRLFPVQFGLIALVTFFSHLKLMNAIEQNARRFSTTFLATMSMRLFIYATFIVICLLIDRTRAISFVISFMILYFIFTIFEVIEISNFLRKNQNSSN
jgi:hypothetical protein